MRTISDNPWLRSLAICVVSLSLLMVTGCNGCRDSDEVAKKEEEEKKKKKRPKPDYQTNTPVLLPGIFPKPRKTEKELDEEKKKKDREENFFDDPVIRSNRVKLGHWYTANFQAIANNFNSEGLLTTHAIDGTSQPVPIPATDYFVSTTRPISLPKGEWKNFETTIFLPNRGRHVAQANVNYTMHRATSGLSQHVLPQPCRAMKPFQHHILLMSDRPDTYKYLSLSDNISLRGEMGYGVSLPPFYFIVPTTPGDPLPLPRTSLSMTTIAYMIWDDFDPAKLEEDHQKAILDWIHFGGQLIVSGPDSLDKLQTSFLANYLPAHFESSQNLTNADVKELNDNWALPRRNNPNEKRKLQISEKVPLLGVTFKPHDDANFIDGAGELVIERRVGRGRIAITAFSINSPTIRSWRSLKSFINGALLRKPPRNFGKLTGEDVGFEWAGDGTSCFDPMINSTLRFVSRDLSVSGTSNKPNIHFDTGMGGGMGINSQYVDFNPGDEVLLKPRDTVNSTNRGIRRLDDNFHYGGFQEDEYAGLGGWNDESGIAIAARDTLKETAGITPPSSSFVLKMLAAYLLILVPVNWVLFRMIGKVEYAWAAAPIIAIVGAFMVVRMASLDIGFVRSNTQVGLLEVHSDYSRGHLSEYSALYTSLSTGYSVDLDNLSAQSLPFAIVNNSEAFSPDESMSEVKLRRTTSNRLEGFQIQSNSTGLLHSEIMLNLGGIVSFSPPKDGNPAYLANSTGIDLSNVGVLTKNSEGKFEFGWIGDLNSAGEADVIFEPADNEQLNEKWARLPEFQSTQRNAESIWNTNITNGKQATMEMLAAIPELQEEWPRYESLFTKVMMDRGTDMIEPGQFFNIYQLVNSSSQVTLGQMLDVVLNNLKLSEGEYRLIGSTEQRLGTSRFDPASTQTDRRTLVIVHLKHPKLPKAERDLNAYEDFKIVSDLDRKREMEELEKAAQESLPGGN